MAKAISTAKIAPVAGVSKLIVAAGKAAASMVEKCREAARLAAAQLDPTKPIAERHAEVVAAYAADFSKVDHNVKAIFSDALLLLCAGTAPISVETGKTTTHTTADKAVNASKAILRAAASEVRQANGMGRKSGGGRKAASKAASKAEAAVGAAPDVATAASVDAFENWLAALADYASDAVYGPKIVAAMAAAGFMVTKAAKGRVVKGSAS